VPAFPHDHPVDLADFDPTGRIVATAARAVRFWSVATGKLLALPVLHANPLPPKYSFDFSPDGTRLATVAGGTLHIWRVPTGEAITPSLEHGARIRSVRYSPRGDYVVTACDDGAARVWDAANGHLLCDPLRLGEAVSYAEFNFDGTRLLTSGMAGTVRVWPVMTAPSPVPLWLPELAEALAGQQLQDDNVNRVTSAASLYRLSKTLAAVPETEFYGRWVRWFLDDGAARPALPVR
jgi:WD40 repeat protein